MDIFQDVHLRSGKWRSSVTVDHTNGDSLEFIDPADPANKMIARLPVRAEELSQPQVERIAREPEVRLWTDDHGIAWRIARVGPGTHYPYPLETPHLVFDSEQAFAGVVAVDENLHLGDLTHDDLLRYRDRIRDFGGRRRAFRPPRSA